MSVAQAVERRFRKWGRNLEAARISNQMRAWRRYGIKDMDEARYAQLLKQQDERCALCGRKNPDAPRRLSVDHDHATGKVRGLLCTRCNRYLGWYESLRDSIAQYLNRAGV